MDTSTPFKWLYFCNYFNCIPTFYGSDDPPIGSSLNARMERTVNLEGSPERAAITVVRCDHCTAIEVGSSYEENEGSITNICRCLSSASHSMP